MGNPLAILSAPGSRGDVNPMVALGQELKRRGYDVEISLAEPYVTVAESAGLNSHSLISRRRMNEILADPSMWSLLRGMRKVVSGVAAEFTRPHFDMVHSLYRPGETVLISHPLDFASRIFRDLEPDVPLVDVHLAPVMLRTPPDPPRLTSWKFEPTHRRRTSRLSYWFGDKLILDPILRGPINRIRAELGLQNVDRIMNHWWLSPDRVLAFYPDWFAPRVAESCPVLRHVGFPLHDGTDEPFDVPTDLPIAFTGGSANWHTQKFFGCAADACRQLNVGGLLLTPTHDCMPDSLPPNVRPQSYAPLGKLLPHCRAIVHHGGIGTTSQALSAGLPQIIRPMAFDQHDNAARISKLGCGVTLRDDRKLVETIRQALEDESMASKIRETNGKLQAENAISKAANEVDAAMTRKTVSP